MHTGSGPADEGEPTRPAQPAVEGKDGRDAEAAYLEVLRELERRQAEVMRIAAVIVKAAEHLEHWRAVHVTHAGVGFPKEVTMLGRSIDAATWPTARQLAEALSAWHESAEQARTTWARLPAETRARMPQP